MSQQTNRPLVGATDSLIALMIAVAAVVWANQQRMPVGGLSEFLQIRVTSLNASFSIVFAVLWQLCMQALGLYRRSSEFLRPMLSAAAGVGLMTLLLGLYLEARRTEGPIWQVLVAFFVAAKHQVAAGCQWGGEIDVVRVKRPFLGAGRWVEGTDVRGGLGVHCHLAETAFENGADIVVGGVPQIRFGTVCEIVYSLSACAWRRTDRAVLDLARIDHIDRFPVSVNTLGPVGSNTPRESSYEFPGFPIQQIREAVLAAVEHDLPLATVYVQIQKNRPRVRVVVIDVMRSFLEVPFQVASVGI